MGDSQVFKNSRHPMQVTGYFKHLRGLIFATKLINRQYIIIHLAVHNHDLLFLTEVKNVQD